MTTMTAMPQQIALRLGFSSVATKEPAVPARRAGDWDVHVGKRLKEGRMLRGLNQAALSDAAGVSYQQIQKYEKGVNRMSADRLVAFADVLGVTPGWFFEGRDELIGAHWEVGGPAESLTAADLAIARDVSRLAPPVRQKIVGLIRALAEGSSH